MNDNQEKIINAAINVLTRYGVKRTTMGHIADAANVSRQTLYNFYPNKEEVLAAAIRWSYDKKISAIKSAWKDSQSIGEKLDIYFKLSVIDYYEILQQTPDSKDLLLSSGEPSARALKDLASAEQALLESELEFYSESINNANLTTEELANFVQNSSRNYKFMAESKEHLESLLKVLKQSVLSLLKV